jgi:hypothetical protein
MKIPRAYHKMSDTARREWLALELQKVRKYERELLKESRILADPKSPTREMERPDLDLLKAD